MDKLGILLLFWVVWCVGFAVLQGLLMPAIRRTPFGTIEQKQQDIALHWLGSFLYFWALLFTPEWLAVAVAIGLRVLIFDIALNAAAGDPLFNVGKTAKTDKVLQYLAAKVGIQVTYLSAFLRLLAFLFLAVILIGIL